MPALPAPDTSIIAKLIDLVRTSLGLKDTPNLICQQSRLTCEAMLKEIWKREVGPLPPKIMFDALLKGITKERPDAIPTRMQALLGTIQIYGNLAAHPQDNLEQLDHTHAIMVESALGAFCNWFFNEYLRMDPAVDVSVPSVAARSADAAAKNYADLLRAALADGVLELDEYESLLDARTKLGLDEKAATKMEVDLVKEVMRLDIQALSEILKPADLESFRKYDESASARPEWMLRTLDTLQTSSNPEWVEHAGHYVKELDRGRMHRGKPILQLLGCWQGWYFQKNAKTYFDLCFVAKSEDAFVGVSLEPLNPGWKELKGHVGPLLYAQISGTLGEDILFSFSKRYVLKDPWEIGYEAVIIDGGRYLEGEWNSGGMIGAFNAMKTRSLLPIRIFDTAKRLPLARTQFVNRIRNVTSTWFLHLQGREAQPAILHLVEVAGKLYANLGAVHQGAFCVEYLEGVYEGIGRAMLESSGSVVGQSPRMIVRFSVDWDAFTISGTVKDDVNTMRALKGVRV